MIEPYHTDSEPAVRHFADGYAKFDRNEVQATYDRVSAYTVRRQLNANWTSGNTPTWLTPNQARELTSLVSFPANGAESLNNEYTSA
jgi:hypothetical protein